MCETAKVISKSPNESFLTLWKRNKEMGSSESIFSAFCFCITQNMSKLYEETYENDEREIRLCDMTHWTTNVKFGIFNIANSTETIPYLRR